MKKSAVADEADEHEGTSADGLRVEDVAKHPISKLSESTGYLGSS